MNKILFALSALCVNFQSFGRSECKTLKLNAYKKIIEAKQKADLLLNKLSADAYFYTQVVKNCYVKVVVNSNKNNSEYWLNYLFDPNGELVNIEPSSGSVL